MFTIGWFVEDETGYTGQVEVDLDKLIATKALIAATSGGGKSWLLRVIAEAAVDKVPTLIIDPEGEFFSLRERHDMLLIGETGDIPLSLDTAGKLGEKIAAMKMSAVVNLFGFAGGYDEEYGREIAEWEAKRRYVATFLRAFFNMPKALWRPRLVLIDETHRFAPKQEGADDAVLECRKMVNTLLADGRKRGIGTIVATQRITKLHNDTVAECQNVFAGRFNLDTDSARMADLLGFHRSRHYDIRNLPSGEFFSYGPAFLNAKGVFRFKACEVKTSHGLKFLKKYEPVAASKQISALIAQLDDIPVQVQEEKDERKAQRKQIDDLKREIKNLKVAQARELAEAKRAAISAIPTVSSSGITEKDRAQLTKNAQKLNQQLIEIRNGLESKFETLLARAFAKSDRLIKVYEELLHTIAPKVALEAKKSTAFPMVKPMQRDLVKSEKAESSNGDVAIRLRAGERLMLQFIAQAGDDGLTDAQLGTLSGFPSGGSTFATYISKLRREKLITSSGRHNWALREGFEYLDGDIPERAMSTIELLSQWGKALRAGENQILQAIVDAYPNPVAIESFISDEMKPATVATYVSKLKRIGLAVISDKHIAASATLFPGQ